MADYRLRAMRRRQTRQTHIPPAKKPPWWKRPINWIIAAVAAGLTSAATSGLSSLFTAGEQTVTRTLTPQAAPLAWTVTMAASDLNNCHSWTFPKPLSALPYHEFDANQAAGDTWALGQGGVERDDIAYTITVQGTGDTQVVLRNLRMKVLSRSPVLHGVTVGSGVGCGAEVTDRYYLGDLGARDPHLLLVNPGAASGVPVVQQYTVSQSDTEVFLVRVLDNSPQQSLFAYEFQLDWSQGNSTGTVNILTPGNKPFQLNATNGSSDDPQYYASGGTWQKLN